MALNQEYFDAIHIDVVKKKYYNANKVEAVFADIRREAEALTAENERMRSALSALADRRVELGDAMLSAQGVYRGIIEKANARAAEIIAEAERRAAAIEEEARQQQSAAIGRVERLFGVMKEQHLAAIEALNSEWQDYLCGLYPEEAPAPEAADEQPAEDAAPAEEAPAREGEAAAAPAAPTEEAAEDTAAVELPPDLAEKVDAIAREIFAIDGDE